MKRKWFKRRKAKTPPTVPPKANPALPKAKKIPIGTRIDLATRYLRTWVQRLVKLLPPIAMFLGLIYIIAFALDNWHKTVLINPHVDPKIGASYDAVSLQSELLANIKDMPTKEKLINDIASLTLSLNPILDPDNTIAGGFLIKETLQNVKNTILNDTTLSAPGKVTVAGVELEALPIIRRFQRLLLRQDFGHLEVYKQADSGATVASVTTDNGLVWRVSDGAMDCAVVNQSFCLGIVPRKYGIDALMSALAYKMVLLPNGDESAEPDWVSQAYYREALRLLDLGVRGIDRNLVELAQDWFEIALRRKILNPVTKLNAVHLAVFSNMILQKREFRQHLTPETSTCRLIANTFRTYQNEDAIPDRINLTDQYFQGQQSAIHFYDRLITKINEILEDYAGNVIEQEANELLALIRFQRILIDKGCFFDFKDNRVRWIEALQAAIQELKKNSKVENLRLISLARTLIGEAQFGRAVPNSDPPEDKLKGALLAKAMVQINWALSNLNITPTVELRAEYIKIQILIEQNELTKAQKEIFTVSNINKTIQDQAYLDTFTVLKYKIWVKAVQDMSKFLNEEKKTCLWDQASEALKQSIV